MFIAYAIIGYLIFSLNDAFYRKIQYQALFLSNLSYTTRIYQIVTNPPILPEMRYYKLQSFWCISNSNPMLVCFIMIRLIETQKCNLQSSKNRFFNMFRNKIYISATKVLFTWVMMEKGWRNIDDKTSTKDSSWNPITIHALWQWNEHTRVFSTNHLVRKKPLSALCIL